MDAVINLKNTKNTLGWFGTCFKQALIVPVDTANSDVSRTKLSNASGILFKLNRQLIFCIIMMVFLN